MTRIALSTIGLLVLALAVPGGANGPKFYPDDPIWVDNDRLFDASGVEEVEVSDYYDFVENTFLEPGERADIAATNINTLGEVPDSTWFVNRIGRQALAPDEIVRGPDRVESLSIEGWPIVQGKNEGLQPGWRVADPDGHLYQIEFDPVSNPEMATGAEIIGTAFYHAFGYHVVEVYLVDVDPERLTIAPTATIRGLDGRPRAFTMSDIRDVLRRSARRPDGTYRALASRFADGEPVGIFRYYGTRSDDPNDIFLHEHRRELRGSRVFGAWLNHDDSRAVNSLVMKEGPEGQKYLKHYMFDFGSILGSGTAFAQTPRAGNEYILDWKEGFLTLATLGLYLRPWLLIDYPDVPPAVGRFESSRFDPQAWRPEYPNPAFENMRADDAFWAARIVSRFDDETIRRLVGKARYSDPAATEYLTYALIERRRKVLRTWLNGVNPLVDLALDPEGRLTFQNAAVAAGVATPAVGYTASWFRFDNTTGAHEPVGGEVSFTGDALQAPAGLLDGADFVGVLLRSHHPFQPHWALPLRVYFRRAAGEWELVGLERGTEMAAEPRPGRPAARER